MAPSDGHSGVCAAGGGLLGVGGCGRGAWHVFPGPNPDSELHQAFCCAEGVGASSLLEAEGRISFLGEVTSEKGKCCSPALQWKFGELGTPGLGPPWVHHAQQQQQRQIVGLYGAVCLGVDVRGKGCYLQQVFFARTMLVTGADTSRACPWQREGSHSPPLPPGADPVPTAPVWYTGTILGL